MFKDVERYEPEVLDSSATKLYKECPRKYLYRMVLGFETKVTQPYFAFGTAYHKFREELELQFAKVDSLDKCLEPAAKRGLKHWQEHGTEAPMGTKWDFLNTERLLKSFGTAFDHWKKEKNSKRVTVLATEQSFCLQLPDGSQTGGRADQIVRWSDGRVWGRDFKTSSKLGDFYERTLEPNDQFTRYTWAETQLAGEQVQGQIVEVLYNSKKEGPKILTFMTSRTKWQIDQWLRDNTFWVSQITRSRELDHYPMNEKNCAFCEYHSVCKMPTESSMLQHLKSNYRLSPWDFSKIHGEES